MLALSVTAHLYPRLEAEHFGAGRLTKIRAQAVSGPACRAVAEQLGVPDLLRAAAPPGTPAAATAVVETERVLASVLEAVIGACYLCAGFERTAAAVVEAFAEQIEDALDHPVDFKSALQERLARRGETVRYEVTEQQRPAARPDVHGGGDRRRGDASPTARGAARSSPSRTPRARRSTELARRPARIRRRWPAVSASCT